jgi:hypothetical protein
MYSSHCVHTKAIKTTKKIVSPHCTQGDCQSNSFTCSKLWFHIAKDPQNDSYYSLCVVWPIKRTAESKLYCKKDFHEIVRQCSCLSHTQKHYTWFDHALHISFSLWTEFQVSQISLSIAAVALSYSCHNMNLFWLKAVGLQFIPRNDNHNVQILIWFSTPIWNKPCFTSTTFKDNGMMLLRHTVVDTPQVFLICIYNFIVTWDWPVCFMSIDNLNYVTLSRFLSKVALLLKMLMRKLFT